MSGFLIEQDRIYIQTYTRVGRKTKYIILDLKGKLLKEVFLPTMDDIPFTAILVGQDVRLYEIQNGKFYYLKNNMENESWEFNVINIKKQTLH